VPGLDHCLQSEANTIYLKSSLLSRPSGPLFGKARIADVAEDMLRFLEMERTQQAGYRIGHAERRVHWRSPGSSLERFPAG
jgi:hypothetical protein